MKRLFVCLLAALSALMLFGCDSVPQQNILEDPTNGETHEHSFAYQPTEEGHVKQCTCGCPYTEVVEDHTDGNGDECCDLCGTALEPPVTVTERTIDTAANFTFFPTEASDLHRAELREAFEAYRVDNSIGVQTLGEYEIYSYVTEEISQQYDLDLFEVRSETYLLYFVRQGNAIYRICPWAFNVGVNDVSHCLVHVAVTDINADGAIEILTSINGFEERGTKDYCTSYIMIIDTRSGHVNELFDDDGVSYFKENRDGVLCIYKTNGGIPLVTDLNNGKLDERYYEKAKMLSQTPKFNNARFAFKSYVTEAECEMFRVEITIKDDYIQSPYLFEYALYNPYFEVTVKMTWLGESFSYTSPDGYKDGATATFVNGDCRIGAEGWGAAAVISHFSVSRGEVIERTYKHPVDPRVSFAEGVYDMVVTYELREIGLSESIVIEDFLTLTRE